MNSDPPLAASLGGAVAAAGRLPESLATAFLGGGGVKGLGFRGLGGSWVATSRVISPLFWAIVILLISPRVCGG